MTDLTPRAEEGAKETEALIASLEAELGVKGTVAVFRKALALAKEASAEFRARQEAYAANDLACRLRSWGENDPDPDYFSGDLLSGVLMDCGAGSEAILVAEAEASSLRDRVAVLEEALKRFTPHARVSFSDDTLCTIRVYARDLRGALAVLEGGPHELP